MLIITDEFKHAVEINTPSKELYQVAKAAGLVSLSDTCKQLVLQGITSIQEYGKITYKLK
jgi:type IV pilus assembly protein PilB